MSEENIEIIQEETSSEKTGKKSAKTLTDNLPRNDDGYVDWLKVIPEKFIIPQEKHNTKPVSELADNEKMILLGGWKHLLKKRGFISKHDIVHASSPDFASVTCRIVWAPHPDSNGVQQTYEASADSHAKNTDSMMQRYLTTNAQNRAFSRCVREYLNINIVGKDETDKATIDEMVNHKKDSPNSLPYSKNPQESLQNLLTGNGFDFGDAIKWFQSKKSQNVLSKEEISELNDWKDIPLKGCYALMAYFQENLKAKTFKQPE